jgi:hypothetical protein
VYEAKVEGSAIIVTMRHAGASGTHSSIDIYHLVDRDQLSVVMVRGVLGVGEHDMISGTLMLSRQ